MIKFYMRVCVFFKLVLEIYTSFFEWGNFISFFFSVEKFSSNVIFLENRKENRKIPKLLNKYIELPNFSVYIKYIRRYIRKK